MSKPKRTEFDDMAERSAGSFQAARMRFALKISKETIREAVQSEDGLDGTDAECVMELIDGVLSIRPQEAAYMTLDYDALFKAAESLLRWINRGEGKDRMKPLYGGHDCDWCGKCVQRALGDFGKALAKIRAWRMPKR